MFINRKPRGKKAYAVSFAKQLLSDITRFFTGLYPIPVVIFRSVFIEHTHKLKKCDKSDDSARTMVPKLLHYKGKKILKQKCNKKDTEAGVQRCS